MDGIGLLVPPSYVQTPGARGARARGAATACWRDWPLLRALADHRLFVLVRK